MPHVHQPRSAEQVRELVAWAAAEETPIEIVGGGSKRGLGRPLECEHVLDLAAMAGITLYEPRELVLSALPGTPIADIEAALGPEGQRLAFEPPDLQPLLGSSGSATLGGVVATNLSGPRRFAAGAVRDHVLGLQAVSGRGEAFKIGGRVVKNVTGYDLSKLLTGSHGTLAVLTEITVKVLPATATEQTALVAQDEAADALALLREAAAAAIEPTGLAYLPAPAAAALNLDGAVAALRVEGPHASVAERVRRVQALAGGSIRTADEAQSRRLWRAIAEVQPYVGAAYRPWDVWRLSVPPASAAGVAAQLCRDGAGECFFDWAGGLIWFAHPPRRQAHESIRAAVAGGNATLVRASADTRRSVPVFPPLAPALAALTARLKDGFDPKRILNRGRMYSDL